MKVSYQLLEEMLESQFKKNDLIEKMARFGLLVEESIECEDGDEVLNFEVLPHRGDMLSVRGVAREIALAEGKEFCFYQQEQEISYPTEDQIKVETPFCQAYLAYRVTSIHKKETPMQIKNSLKKMDINTTDFVVDLTNWMSFYYGQPCHAFDANKIELSSFVVRESKEGEQFKALNDQVYTLKKGALVIADKNQIHALAGVIGGYDSMVTEQTTDIILEVASFDMKKVQSTSSEVGLRTDASDRFSKGTDRSKLKWVAQKYIDLLKKENPQCEITQVANYDPEYLPREIELRKNQVSQIVGYRLTDQEIIQPLEKLGFYIVKKKDQSIIVRVPSHRNDIELECDLVEDILRSGSYDSIKEKFPRVPMSYYGRHKVSKEDKLKESLRRLCQFHGMMEWVNYSFMPSSFTVSEKVERVSHPINNQMDILRTSLIPGMIKSLAHNMLKVQTERVNQYVCYEIGKIFGGNGTKREENALAVIGVGESGKRRIQSLIEDISKSITALAIKNQTQPYLKEGESGRIVCVTNQKYGGEWGCVCPQWLKKLGLTSKKKLKVYILELKISAFLETAIIENAIFKEWPSYPAVLRDLVILLKSSISYQEIIDQIEKVGLKELHSHHFFDLYQGEHIPEGHKSIGISLYFQSVEKTLSDEEVDVQYNQILKKLESSFGGTLREK